MTAQITTPYPMFFDASGRPLEGGYIYIGTANLPAITNQITVYWDFAMTIPATQPIRLSGGMPVYAGSPGRLFIPGDTCSVTVLDHTGKLMYSLASYNEFSGSALYATLASPAFTGVPTAPTASASDSSTQLATTAFVQAQKASPTFTGSPAAPTPAQFDNDTSLATTAFVQRALGNFSGIAYYSTNATIDPSNAGKAVNIGMATAGQTMQLPAANLVPAGAAFYIFNQGQAYNLIRSAADSLSVDGSLSTTLTIPIAGAVTAISNGANAWSITGTGVLGYMQSFGASNTTNGYGRQPNGLIEQWGYSVGQSSNNNVVTFPVAFPNALHSVTSMLINSSNYPATIKTTSQTGFTWERVSGSTGFSILWMAKGY